MKSSGLPMAYANSAQAITPRSTDTVTRVLDFVGDKVLIDSGASDHMHPNVDDLLHVENHENQVMLSDGSKIGTYFNGILRVRLTDVDSGRHLVVPLTGCIAVPGLVKTLWSVSKFAEEGHQIIFQKDYITLVLFAVEPDQRTLIRIRAPTFINSNEGMPVQVNYAFSFNTWATHRATSNQDMIESDTDSSCSCSCICNSEDSSDDDNSTIEHPLCRRSHQVSFKLDDDLPSLCSVSKAFLDNDPHGSSRFRPIRPLPSFYDSLPITATQLDKLQNLARAAQRVQPYFINPVAAYRHKCINDELRIFRHKLKQRGMLAVPDLSRTANERDPFIWLRQQFVNEAKANINRILFRLGDVKSKSCQICNALIYRNCNCYPHQGKFLSFGNNTNTTSSDHHDIAYYKLLESGYDPRDRPQKSLYSPWSIHKHRIHFQSPFDSFNTPLPFTLEDIRQSQRHYSVGDIPGITFEYRNSHTWEDCRGRILLPPPWHKVLFAFMHVILPSPAHRDHVLSLIEQRFTWHNLEDAFDNYRFDQCDQITSTLLDTKRFNQQENYSQDPATNEIYSIRARSKFPFELNVYRKSSIDLPETLTPDELFQYTLARYSFPHLSYDHRPYKEFHRSLPTTLKWDQDSTPRLHLKSIDEIPADEPWYPSPPQNESSYFIPIRDDKPCRIDHKACAVANAVSTLKKTPTSLTDKSPTAENNLSELPTKPKCMVTLN